MPPVNYTLEHRPVRRSVALIPAVQNLHRRTRQVRYTPRQLRVLLYAPPRVVVGYIGGSTCEKLAQYPSRIIRVFDLTDILTGSEGALESICGKQCKSRGPMVKKDVASFLRFEDHTILALWFSTGNNIVLKLTTTGRCWLVSWRGFRIVLLHTLSSIRIPSARFSTSLLY